MTTTREQQLERVATAAQAVYRKWYQGHAGVEIMALGRELAELADPSPAPEQPTGIIWELQTRNADLSLELGNLASAASALVKRLNSQHDVKAGATYDEQLDAVEHALKHIQLDDTPYASAPFGLIAKMQGKHERLEAEHADLRRATNDLMKQFGVHGELHHERYDCDFCRAITKIREALVPRPLLCPADAAAPPLDSAEPFDDDIFQYDNGPMRQCISGFGKNAIDAINEEIASGSRASNRGMFYIHELVRWCRAFNRENHELRAELAEQKGGTT